MSIKNAFYAQSGGVTAVINASACGVIETARKNADKIAKVYAGKNGILGALREELIDTSIETSETIAGLKSRPGGAFGSCRYKLKNLDENRREYERLIDVFKAHDIGYFFYNGGGDSQDTAYKVSQLSEKMGYPITCVGIPKTVDNDLPLTDNCPGFGSVAKYISISTKEAALDIQSMCESSTKIFVLEVMGRHAGWIAAAGALAKKHADDAPQLILLPEVTFNAEVFLQEVDKSVKRNGYCVIVASEGIKYENGSFVADSGQKDAFGHTQLGGVAPTIAKLINDNLGYKYHWAVADYLQRSARHIASATDVQQAYMMGQAAVEFALAGKNAVMPTIERVSNSPYQWKIGQAPLSEVANKEKEMPQSFISQNGFGISEEGLDYLRPLVMGEDYPEYDETGMPIYVELINKLVPKKLKDPFLI